MRVWMCEQEPPKKKAKTEPKVESKSGGAKVTGRGSGGLKAAARKAAVAKKAAKDEDEDEGGDEDGDKDMDGGDGEDGEDGEGSDEDSGSAESAGSGAGGNVSECRCVPYPFLANLP